MRVNPVEEKPTESVLNDRPGRFCAISSIPILPANPEAQFRSFVSPLNGQTDSPYKTSGFLSSYGQIDPLPGPELRDARSSISNNRIARQRLNLRSIGEREGPEQKPFGFEGGNGDHCQPIP